MTSSEKKDITVTIPAELAEKIQERLKGTEFNTVSNYVTYILKKVVSNMEEKEGKKEKEEYSEDEKLVRKRLKDLGYTD